MWKKTTIALALPFLINGKVYSAAGSVGENGASTNANGSIVDLIGAESVGNPGPNNLGYDGEDGKNLSSTTLSINGEIITGAAGSQGGNQSQGASGAGGQGGGSVFGGISSGGSGVINYSTVAGGQGGKGGSGGDIRDNSITITNTELIGGAGGRGGDVINLGGAGAGGNGGGSVIGGMTSGGAAGGSYNGTPSNGGNGGFVIGSTIILGGDTKLIGAAGGEGAYIPSAYGGGSDGGHGGGSVFGGISSAGAAGLATYANGGNGGRVGDNTITFTGTTTLTGAQGGTGTGYKGGSGSGGLGGGSVIGGISSGGTGGEGLVANGGSGGAVTGNTIILAGTTTMTGASGGGSISSYRNAGTGVEGHGGGSVFGGLSLGGAGGYSYYPSGEESNGGNGGEVGFNRIELSNATLVGASASNGAGIHILNGGVGAAGYGGGSIFGGISLGGAAGYSGGIAHGGNAGAVTNNIILLTGTTTLTGASGGHGGTSDYGGGAAGGHGGGSVFGGISGGAAGAASGGYGYTGASSNGGNGGNIAKNTITISDATLTGAIGGDGGDGGGSGGWRFGGGGDGGHGGGSVIGGVSSGGAAGASTIEANGGRGGEVSGNTIFITNSTLIGAAGGSGGSAAISSSGTYGSGGGADGYGGGSIFGGISSGGSAGYNYATTGSGGAGGSVTGNKITLSGLTLISGDVYGGISRGGASAMNVESGKGGLTTNNVVTIIGDDVSIGNPVLSAAAGYIGGSIYGGLSVNGDKSINTDEFYNSYYAGNTLKIQSGHFQLYGSIKNFQYYNWLLPENELNGGTIITVDPTYGNAVDISNTIHSVDVKATGNVLDGGDQVILITQVTGQPKLKSNSRVYIEQGFFIVYDAEMIVQNNGATGSSLVLNVLGVNDNNPDGKIHPESEEFLKGRIAQLALVDQGADMISDGISYARASLRKENANLFTIIEGGANKYKNGGASTLKLNDFKFAVGAAKAIEFGNKSVGMVAAFAEHGNANYNSYNYFDYFEDTRGFGKLRYSGTGLMFHMDVAGTDVSEVQNKPNIFDDKYGLYIDAALRVGHIKVDFHSADMVNGAGVEASYNTKSRYASAMAGVGYVWTLDEKQAVDLYGRFTFSRLNGKDIQVVDEQMYAGAAHSKRMRLGARYGYTYSDKVTPYAGVAFERNFTGDVTGSAYEFTIKETSLKGNTGIVEAGVMIKPKGAQDPFSMHLGVQGSFGQRKGVTAGVRARYVF